MGFRQNNVNFGIMILEGSEGEVLCGCLCKNVSHSHDYPVDNAKMTKE
jgi:hypothetical protein